MKILKSCQKPYFIVYGYYLPGDGKEVDGDSDNKSVIKESSKEKNVKMDTSKGEKITPLNDETLDWLRDCFKDLLATNSS